MKKQYDHKLAMDLLDKMEACVKRVKATRQNFENAISASTKKAA